jgi:hypothetical protein
VIIVWSLVLTLYIFDKSSHDSKEFRGFTIRPKHALMLVLGAEAAVKLANAVGRSLMTQVDWKVNAGIFVEQAF